MCYFGKHKIVWKALKVFYCQDINIIVDFHAQLTG